MTTLVTATEWQNFFSLRAHRDAQPEFHHLAVLMLEAYVGSTPEAKAFGEWHIPFGDRMPEGTGLSDRLKIATARAARVSYLTMEGQINVEKDIALHDSLSQNGHWSPFEHACMAAPKGSGNFVGWQQYRHTFRGENRTCNLKSLLVTEGGLKPSASE
jgi:thymidylate synthase ThyX